MTDPAWMDEAYTCGCGLYVHSSRYNPRAIHIPDCEYATKKEEPVEPPREIDAAEAARLLTAAFTAAKMPLPEQLKEYIGIELEALELPVERSVVFTTLSVDWGSKT